MATAQITSDQDAILAEVSIAARPARVFEAMADPKQRTEARGKKEVFRVVESKSDLRPGGKGSFEGVGPDNAPFHMEGEYLEVEPAASARTGAVADFVGDFTTLVRSELEPREVRGLDPAGTHKLGTGTLVRVRHSSFAGYLDQARSHSTGWSASLGWLKDYVEQGVTFARRD